VEFSAAENSRRRRRKSAGAQVNFIAAAAPAIFDSGGVTLCFPAKPAFDPCTQTKHHKYMFVLLFKHGLFFIYLVTCVLTSNSV